jgi:enoyl-CoA hydratase
MADTPPYSTIVTERIGKVERITLNRPEKRNALSPVLQDEIIHAVQTAERSGEVRAIVLRGAGPSFCAGYDINPQRSDREAVTLPVIGRENGNDKEYVRHMTVEEDVAMCISLGERWGKLWNCRIPVIAQVHGYCVAGGTDVALHCDMIIAAHDAQIGFPPVRAQGGPPTHMWIYHAGPQWSKRLLLTGDFISGRRAAQVGLVLESVDADALDDHVMALAQRIALIPHDLLVHNKRVVNFGVELMGRTAMSMLGGIHDALAHLAPEVADFNQRLRSEGVRVAVGERDAAFHPNLIE